MEEPSLVREIGKLGWLVTKVLLALGIVVCSFVWLFQHNPFVGYCIFFAVMIVGQIIFFGWHTYQWKKKDWKRWKDQEEHEREWQAARERPRLG
jgi:type VI protein secretion system component VasK